MDTDGTAVPELTETAAAPTEAAPESTLAYSSEPPLDYDDPDEYPTELIAPRSWSVAAGLAALVVVLGVVVAVLVWLVGVGSHKPAQPAEMAQPGTPGSSVTVTDAPSDPADVNFIEQLRAHNVPVDDWRDSVEIAQVTVQTMRDDGQPRGNQAVGVMHDTTRELQPDWSEAQVRNFTAAALNAYAPDLWPYTDAELAALSPDDRFVALVESDAPVRLSENPQMVGWGRQVCADLGSGVQYQALVDRIDGGNQGKRGWASSTGRVVVDSAITVFCPGAAA